jgi:hypothetical protein
MKVFKVDDTLTLCDHCDKSAVVGFRLNVAGQIALCGKHAAELVERLSKALEQA